MIITVSVVQMDVATSKPEENLEKGESYIAEAARRGSDLVCFPEMWTTGFNWANNRRMAREHKKVIDRVAGMAKQYGIWINGSMLTPAGEGDVSNTSILFDPEGGRAGTYSKAHLFSMLHEDEHVEAGNSLCVVDTPWGRTGLTVCYDIRFPELFRTYALMDAKIILSPMAFPYPRVQHWKVLVRARAIENQLFMVGPNQVGSEDFGPDGTVTYFGDSVVIDPWGQTVIEASETGEMLLTTRMDVGMVDEVRGKMNVLGDRRPDLYELG